jgi:hypothetical protein
MKNCLSVFCLSLVASLALAQSDSVRVIRSVATASPILDGRLETEWLRTPAETDFIQLNPDEGNPATQRTEVRIMHSTDALYVAFRCWDNQPDKIMSILSKHDRLGDCDQITFYLDPYHDHRTGYFFTTNPSGVQQEGVFYNDDWMDTSWDGLWEVASAKDDSGWTAEMKIPFSSLRFNNTDQEMVWGVNAQRYLWRVKESTYWQRVTRDRGRRVSGFGHLEGLSGLHPGQGLELRPYAVANFEEDLESRLHGRNDFENLGLDVKYRLASNLTLDATVNPDFAQIEADDEVINLSDYPVYLQEKRPFFLEGASIFDTPWDLFYSRRISDPDAGAKVSGKVGSFKLMALAARNRTEERLSEDFGVLRLKRDVLKRSEVGMLFTDKQGPEGDYGRVWALDSRLQFGDPVTVTTMLAQSYKPGIKDQNLAHRVEYSYYVDKYAITLAHAGLMQDFNINDAGFMNYSNYQRAYAFFQGNTRPEKGGIRRLNSNFELGTETEYDLRFPRGWFNANINLTTMNYMYAGLGWYHGFSEYRRQYVDSGEPYEDYDNVGQYNRKHYTNGSEWWFWYETDFSKPIAIAWNYDLGNYRDGYQHSAGATFQVRPWSNLEMRLNGQRTYVSGVAEEEDNGEYIVGRFKVDWTLTTKIFTRLNVQYVHGDRAYLTNALLGYNFAPESWFYLVYDETKEDILGWGPQDIQDRRIKMKVSYFVKV